MTDIIVFGVGSAIIGDVEESLHRAGHRIVAGVCNRASASHLSEGTRELILDDLDADLVKLPYLVPLFGPRNREIAVGEARYRGFSQPFNLIDPSVATPRTLQLGEGIYINAGCSLGSRSNFESFVFVNRGASIGHHAHIEQFASIGPGVAIAGHVRIGRGVLVGVGATILPKVVVGANAVVGAGAVVTRDVPPGCLVLGNPARVVRRLGEDRGLEEL